MPSVDEKQVRIASENDILSARHLARELAAQTGFIGSDLTVVATAISEVARNILEYAGDGEIVLRAVQDGDRSGILVVATDQGPGIDDIERAMQDGYSTGHSLGLGLPGARRLMDEFEIRSELDRGTTVTMTKWVSNGARRVAR
jgi:serine/threonine-protein kinase RsbT